MQRVTVGIPIQIRSDPFVDVDGETPLVVSPAPVVTVTNAIGTVLAAPVATDDGTGTGRWVATLTATHLAQVDRLTVTWTGGGQTQRYLVDVASGRYASIADLRRIPVLANPGEFPTTRLAEAITEFEDLADRYRGVAWVRRVNVDVVRLGYRKDYLSFPRAEVRAVRQITGPNGILAVAGWAWDGAGLVAINAAAAGVLYPVSGYDYDATVVWEHGLDDGIPEGLRRGCVEYVRSTVLKESTGLSRDIIATAEQGFVTRYSTPSWPDGRPSGFLEVDRLLNELPDRRLPGVG